MSKTHFFCLGTMFFMAGSCGIQSNLETATPDSSSSVTAPVEATEEVKSWQYPGAARTDHKDDYHGTKVADPYRWLEDTESQQTRTWIEGQSELTASYFESIATREQIRSQLREMFNYERYGLPYERGGRYFISKNDGLQNQSVWYWTDQLKGDLRLLLDPNSFSDDGTVAISGLAISDDGRLLAYALSESGSDWKTWKVREVESGRELDDVVKWGKFSSATWAPDNSGFYYSRYDEPAAGKALSAANYYHKLYFHRLGTSQTEDELIYERKDQKEWGFGAEITDDGRYLTIDVSVGTDRRNMFFYQDLRRKKRRTVELLPELEASYHFLGNRGTIFWFRTDLDAPRGRVIAMDIRKPQKKRWREVIPEQKHTLSSVQLVGNRLIANYMQDAHSVVKVHDVNGKLERELPLPGIGTAYGFKGKFSSKETFYGYKSVTRPTTIYRYDIEKGTSEIFRSPKVNFNPEDFVTTQVFYASKDGTQVPMFITHRQDWKPDGQTPTYLYGYGGFGISLTPKFSEVNMVWLNMGGIYVQPSLRGGGEYGQSWHEAGMKLNKQNVFDDFISAAQWLIDNRYTNPKKLAIGGRSNGGLLVGAAITQRPDLFGAALAGVGVMDMLRFQEFTIGRAWVSDYGSSANAQEFAALYAYSPYHNVVKGTNYPATLIYTGDHDDRVFPAHSYKFAAALQHAQGNTNEPIMIRIDTKAGHGSGKPIRKQIDEWTDLWSFLVDNLEFQVKNSK